MSINCVSFNHLKSFNPIGYNLDCDRDCDLDRDMDCDLDRDMDCDLDRDMDRDMDCDYDAPNLRYVA